MWTLWLISTARNAGGFHSSLVKNALSGLRSSTPPRNGQQWDIALFPAVFKTLNWTGHGTIAGDGEIFGEWNRRFGYSRWNWNHTGLPQSAVESWWTAESVPRKTLLVNISVVDGHKRRSSCDWWSIIIWPLLPVLYVPSSNNTEFASSRQCQELCDRALVQSLTSRRHDQTTYCWPLHSCLMSTRHWPTDRPTDCGLRACARIPYFLQYFLADQIKRLWVWFVGLSCLVAYGSSRLLFSATANLFSISF